MVEFAPARSGVLLLAFVGRAWPRRHAPACVAAAWDGQEPLAPSHGAARRGSSRACRASPVGAGQVDFSPSVCVPHCVGFCSRADVTCRPMARAACAAMQGPLGEVAAEAFKAHNEEQMVALEVPGSAHKVRTNPNVLCAWTGRPVVFLARSPCLLPRGRRKIAAAASSTSQGEETLPWLRHPLAAWQLISQGLGFGATTLLVRAESDRRCKSAIAPPLT